MIFANAPVLYSERVVPPRQSTAKKAAGYAAMEDKKLIRTIERNPEKGIALALDLYGDAVKTICREILAGAAKQDVEEAIAETFIRLWRYGKSFRPGKTASLKSYIYGIARNAAMDKARALYKGGNTVRIEHAELTNGWPGAEEQVIKKEEELAVRQVVAEMAEPDRTIFAMRFFQDYKVKEIALKMNLSEKQVENRLFRSKSVLKEKLKERGIR